MGHRDEAIAAECCGAVGQLLVTDAAGDGSVARDAVQLVADLVKLRRCLIRPLFLYKNSFDILWHISGYVLVTSRLPTLTLEMLTALHSNPRSLAAKNILACRS